MKKIICGLLAAYLIFCFCNVVSNNTKPNTERWKYNVFNLMED